MGIKVKSNGAYVDAVNVFHKRAGAYEAVQGVSVKIGDAYADVGLQKSAPLDGDTSGLFSAVSVRKLIAAYAGACVRVRRSSDNAEQDIGFVGNAIDSSALLAFVGAGSGFIRTGYDQSGSGNHFVQTTATSQPRIVNAGVLDSKMVFDGSNDLLSSLNTSGSPAALVVFLGGKLRSTASAQMLIEHGTNWSVGTQNNAAAYWNGSGALEVGMSELGLSNRSLGIYNGLAVSDNVHTYAFDRAQATYDTSACVFVDGVRQARSSSNNASFKPAGLFSNLVVNVGGRAGGAMPAGLDLRDLVIYNAAKSDIEIARVAASLA